MRAYMEKHLPRNIPIGYSNADHIEFRVSLANFMQCGEEGYVDFFGVNSYQWCGENTFKGSGYDSLVEAYSNYSLPVFFSEFGCNEVRPRLWQEVDALYSDKMTGVFSGGLVYEFTQEEADYGIVKLSQSEAGKGDAQILEEFDPLAKAFKRADPKIPSGLEIVPRSEKCGKPSDYPGIVANNTLPATLGADLIKKGVDSDKFVRGKFIDASKLTTKSSYKVKDYDGKAVDASVDKTTDVTPGQHSKDDDSAASSKQVMIGSSILAAATALFFSF
jgi:1,3-beta-glucanosyltransferase GAS4